MERVWPVSSFRERYLTNIWNLPNILTIVRMLLIPVFVVLHIMGHGKLALLVFCIASFTDWLDGHIARSCNLITDFGKLMDPLADKLMVCTALVMQGIEGVFPVVAIVIVIIKELVMIYGSSYMLHRNIVVQSNMWGKLAQCSFILALVLSFWHHDFEAMALPIDRVILWIAVVIAVIALVDYTLASLRTLRGLKQQHAG
ncbi:MAG: CDP-diacylglycerol--glycerol-3-phosphate 3-phosphatidyltransferase [Clostridia bacterium]|nr:CDP-diacylglycerol--glycerol-3-phosphate 3-phosphatidyltransferase [Clostridia bacterium]